VEIQGVGTTRGQDREIEESQSYLKQDVESSADEEGTGHGVEQLTRKAQQEVSKIADEARRQVTTQLANQKDQAAATLSGVGAAIREAGEDPQRLGQTPVAPLTAQAAEQMEKASAYLRRRDLTTLRLEIEQLARTRTPLFVFGALATGWLGARFLKSRMPADSGRSVTYSPTMLDSSPANVEIGS